MFRGHNLKISYRLNILFTILFFIRWLEHSLSVQQTSAWINHLTLKDVMAI